MNVLLKKSLSLTLILCAGSLIFFGNAIAQNTVKTEKVIPVRAKACTLENPIEMSGEVEAEIRADLHSNWQSLLTKVYLNKGDPVKKGQLLALVDTKDDERNLDIYEGYLSLYSDHLESLAADLKLLQDRTEKNRPLLSKGFISQSQFETIEKSSESIQAAYEQSAAARNEIQSQIRLIKNQIQNAQFVSPIDGVISEIVKEARYMQGPFLTAYQGRVATIEKPGAYLVKTKILDMALSKISPEDPVEVKLTGGGRSRGRIRDISPISVDASRKEASVREKGRNLSQTPSLYQITVRFEHPGPLLLPGLKTVLVFSSKDQTKAELCLPWNAVFVKGEENSVRIFREKEGWRRTRVLLGRRGRDYVEVTKGVTATDLVESRLW